MGDVDSSECSGSDSCPSDDNLPATVLNKVIASSRKQRLVTEKKILKSLLKRNGQVAGNSFLHKRNVKLDASYESKTQSIQDLGRHKRKAKTITDKVEIKKTKLAAEQSKKQFTLPITIDVSSQTENKYTQYFK
eukprot:TRINITY_DN14532_c0_g2_i2.p2 TRINITY_DN14532_c0_g2~~TRINITY_DN14532_c0_g2_i2.p2  ORF type:complete len:134 (+),score=23.00 TRINITY_DN14532_c0_g2_i2:242-643(+)